MVDDRELARDSFVPPASGGRWPWRDGFSWVLGTGALLTVVGATSVWAVEHFAARLDQSVKTELLSSGIDASQLEFEWDYRDVVVTGELPADSSREQLLAVLRNADDGGVRNVRMNFDVVEDQPEGQLFGTVDVTVLLKDGSIVLDGSVLSDNQRQELQSAAESVVGAALVTNNIVVTGYQEKTPGSDQRVASLASSIAGLDKGVMMDARLSATDFRFNATVADEKMADDLLRLRGSAGDLGLVITGDIVARQATSDGELDVVAKKENGRILLRGTVTDESHRQTLLRAAIRAFDQQSVIDEITVVRSSQKSEASDRAVTVLAEAIDHFDEAIEAEAILADETLVFNVLMEREEETLPVFAVTESAKRAGLQSSGSIEARQISLSKEVLLLQAEIDQLEEEIRQNVVFESAKADLDFTAKLTLDKVVDAMNRYLRPVVEVAGHTDNSGSSENNRKLSLFRATAVLEYLKSSGIDGLRLRAVGLGESSPIASNSTEVGKNQNRRVEFSATDSFENQE